MRYTVIAASMALLLSGCASQMQPKTTLEATTNDQPSCQEPKIDVPSAACLGDTALPPSLVGKFEPIDDPTLLASATGKTGEGKLCQGQVYQAKAGETITVYRGWNSRNSYTRLGSWWAAQMPSGFTRDYRVDYEICYKWSPLDKLVRCELKPGTKVVVGTGQSVACSPYPSEYPKTYILPVSDKKQVYIENAGDATVNCEDFDNEFNWVKAK